MELGPREIDFLINLGLAFLCGLLIGGERELKRKPAGIGTQTLVIAGSMMFAFISGLVGDDPARIAAQIVSGVGFLGAGIIIKSEKHDKVTNLTTAASIWYAASVGMALGFGMHVMAVAASIFAALVNSLPHLRKDHEE